MLPTKDHSENEPCTTTTYVFPPCPDPPFSEADAEPQVSSSTRVSIPGTGGIPGSSTQRKMSGSGVAGVSPASRHSAKIMSQSSTGGVRGISPPRLRKALLKTSSVGLGTSAFGSEGERHRTQSSSSGIHHTHTTSPSSASSLSNIKDASSGGSGHRVPPSLPSVTNVYGGNTTISASVTGFVSNPPSINSGGVGGVQPLPKIRPKSALKGHIRSAR